LRGAKEDTHPDPLLVARHLRFGWWSLAVFATLGFGLELLHGFKIGLYLDVANETRRLMWTLTHAHGTLLSLIHLVFAFTLRMAEVPKGHLRQSSTALMVASVLLPGGFFLGGVQFYAGDPGIGVALVPVGAALVIYAAVSTARAIGRSVN
jgi:hypothetical protein